MNRLQRRQRFGSMFNPVRTNGDLLRVPQPVGPVPWTWDGSPPDVFWIGRASEDGFSPIGPHGPGPVSTGVPAVERATGLIVGPLTSAWPWRVYRGSWMGADAEPLVLPTWLRDPCLVNNTPGIDAAQQWFLPIGWKKPAARFWAETIRHALWFGRGWVMFQESTEFTPLAGTFLNVSPTAVQVRDDGLCDVHFDDGPVTTDRQGRFNHDGDTWRLASVAEPLGDGTGVVGRHAADLNIAVNVAKYTSQTFRSGIPAGYLKVSQQGLTQDQAAALKSAWMNAHGSVRGIAVLNATTDFNPITFSPVDSALVEVDHMVTRRVAHCFNLSGWALDAGTAGNDYANITDRRQDKVDDTLMPWKRAVEDSLSALLPYGTWLELETRGYLQTDPDKRMSYYKSGQEVGAFTAEYVQDLERVPAKYRPTAEPEQPAATEEGQDDADVG